MNRSGYSVVLSMLIGLVTLTGCVQMPTHSQTVVEQKANISFKFAEGDSRLANARVLVDRLDSGKVADFIDGKHSLQILSGTRRIQVINGADTILDERVYLGDGVSRPFTIK